MENQIHIGLSFEIVGREEMNVSYGPRTGGEGKDTTVRKFH